MAGVWLYLQGYYAKEFALSYPEEVTALVLITRPVSGAPRPGKLPPAIRSFADALDEADDADNLDRINEIEAHMWLDGPVSTAGRVTGELRELFLDMNGIALQMPDLNQEIEPDSAYERVSELAQPALVLWGDMDFPHVKERCRYLAGSIPGATGHEIAGAAHLASLEKSQRVNKRLQDFLAAQLS